MSFTSNNPGKDFLYARLHGLWSNAVQGEFLVQLAESATEENCCRLLNQHGIACEAGRGFQRSIKEHELAVYTLMQKLVSKEMAEYFTSVINDFDFENLKLLLHARFLPDDLLYLDDLLVKTNALKQLDIKKLLALRDLNEFCDKLPCSPQYRPQLTQIAGRLAENHDMMEAECALDRLEYSSRLDASLKLSQPYRQPAEELVRREIDGRNLSILLRNINFYHFSNERMQDIWLIGGTLSTEFLDSLNAGSSPADLIAALPPRYARILAPLVSQELYISENALWSNLWQDGLKLFRDTVTPEKSLIAFPYLLRFETMNIVRIYEAIRFGLPASDLKKMLIGKLPSPVERG